MNTKFTEFIQLFFNSDFGFYIANRTRPPPSLPKKNTPNRIKMVPGQIEIKITSERREEGGYEEIIYGTFPKKKKFVCKR